MIPSLSVSIEQTPEGIWAVTESDIRGLYVEDVSPDAVVSEVRRWAPELLAENGQIAPGQEIRLFLSLTLPGRGA